MELLSPVVRRFAMQKICSVEEKNEIEYISFFSLERILAVNQHYLNLKIHGVEIWKQNFEERLNLILLM